MRIFGADGFGDKDTSINAIPVNYITAGDVCLVKIGSDQPQYTPAIYFYEYFTEDGNDENIPLVIVPLDNTDQNLNLNQVGDDGGRWKLKSIYTNRLFAEEVTTTFITPTISGGPIYLGNGLTVNDDGVIVQGQVTINSELTEPPLVVNSSVMVNNFNANYLGGRLASYFLPNDNNQTLIPYGCTEMDVYMTYPMIDPPNYSVMTDISNIVDADPAIYTSIITKKEAAYFTIKFSGIIDSINYVLHYFLIGDVDVDAPPPSGSPVVDTFCYLQPASGGGALNLYCSDFPDENIEDYCFVINTPGETVNIYCAPSGDLDPESCFIDSSAGAFNIFCA